MKNKFLFTVVLLSLVLASCESDSIPTPTKTPNPTATLTSTPIPVIPTSLSTVTFTPTPVTIKIQSAVVKDIFFQDHPHGKVQIYISNTEGFNAEITAGCKHDGEFGILITYTLPKGLKYSKGYVGIDFTESPFDASKFSALTFYVKGKNGGETFDIPLFAGYGADLGVHSIKYVNVSATQWQRVYIPMNSFAHTYPNRTIGVDTIAGFGFRFTSDDNNAVICIDNISFIK